MAGIADFSLGSAFLYLAGFVNDMTADAGHVIGFVRAGEPVQQVIVTLVAFQTDAILGLQRRRLFPAKADQPDLIRRFGMLAAWTMASFTTLSRKQRTTIRFLAVFGADNLVEMIFVAFLAHLHADVGTTGINQACENIWFVWLFSSGGRAQ